MTFPRIETVFEQLRADIEAGALVLRFAIARIELANSEGDGILSAWLPGASAALARLDAAAKVLPAKMVPRDPRTSPMDEIAIIETQCRRCGTPLRTLSRSPLGLDELRGRIGCICASCTTPEEQAEIAEAQVQALALANYVRGLQGQE